MKGKGNLLFLYIHAGSLAEICQGLSQVAQGSSKALPFLSVVFCQPLHMLESKFTCLPLTSALD